MDGLRKEAEWEAEPKLFLDLPAEVLPRAIMILLINP